jgi:hypothetical protein
VLALADRVSYRIEPSVASGDVLEVRMRDSSIHRRRVRALLGSPAAPLSVDALVTKFVDCGSRALRPRSTEELRDIAARLLGLEKEQNLRAVVGRL